VIAATSAQILQNKQILVSQGHSGNEIIAPRTLIYFKLQVFISKLKANISYPSALPNLNLCCIVCDDTFNIASDCCRNFK
jgi:hypothetical protein